MGILIKDSGSKKEEKLRKPTGNDLRTGNATLPLIRTLSLARSEDQIRVQESMQTVPMADSKLTWALDLVKEHRGAEYTLERARKHIKDAKEALENFENSSAKKALLSIADYIVDREF